MGDIVKIFAEVQAENIHCSSLINPPQNDIEENYQIGQAWFPLDQSNNKLKLISVV